MKKLALILILLLSVGIRAHTEKEKHTEPDPPKDQPAAPPVLLSRSFSDLDAKIKGQVAALDLANQQLDAFTEQELALRFQSNDSAMIMRAKAQTVIEEIEKEEKFIDNLADYLTGQKPVVLPIGIKKNLDESTTFIMGVSKMTINKDYAKLEIFVRIQLPQIDENGKQRELFFGATDVKLSHKGGIYEEATLSLFGDVGIPMQGNDIMLVLKGGFNLQTGQTEEKTFVKINCEGVEEIGLAAALEFSRNKILPLTETNQVAPAPARVSINFDVNISAWNDFMVDLSVNKKFMVKGVDDTIFEMKDLVIDFSDTKVATGITWPDGYVDTYLGDADPTLWKGVYVKTLEVFLPKQFAKRNNNQRVSFAAEHLLIDSNGVSGKFKANNILPIADGSADGWQFSVDRFGITLVAGKLTQGSFGGSIVLPVTSEAVQDAPTVTYIDANGEEKTGPANPESQEERQSLVYNASISPGMTEGAPNVYVLNVSTATAISFDLFKAKTTLTENSYIELKLDDGKFRPKAVLHGNMAIKGSNDGASSSTATADFEGILFTDLQLQTISPKIKVGTAGYNGNASTVGNFPASINDVKIITPTESTVAVVFDLGVNLMDNSKLSATTTLEVQGSLGENGGYEKWKFQRIKVNELQVAGDLGFKLDGSVAFREDDPVYGNGFAGRIKAEFPGGILVDVDAAFGKTDFRYWYVDGLVDNLNIPVGGGLNIQGFGGGAAYHMAKNSVGATNDSASGIKYVPDASVALNVKALLLYNVGRSNGNKAVHGGLSFEMAFNPDYSIGRVSLFGDAHMLQDPDYDDQKAKLKGQLAAVANSESQVSESTLNQDKNQSLIEAARKYYPSAVVGENGMHAYAGIAYDFNNKIFQGSFELYVDLASGAIRGVGNNNRAGWAEVLFSPAEWYIKVGTPQDPVGLKMGISEQISATSQSYFMLGNKLDLTIQPPGKIVELLPDEDLSGLGALHQGALEGGTGIAFGSQFGVDTGDLTFLMFYANFNAGLGFDIMIRDYGDTACAGTGQIGVNGWYGSGQAYAYLQGKLGIKVKAFGIKKKINIIEGEAAALLQAQLPNPVWIRGFVRQKYSVLGGTIKGQCNFKLQFGKQCDIINESSPVEGLKMIADIKPDNNGDLVDPFTIPQVAFNVKVGEVMSIEDFDGVTHKYRFKLDDFSILNKDTGRKLIGEQLYNDDKTILSFEGDAILPSETDLELNVSILFEEKVNGQWITLIDDEGKSAREVKSVQFRTDKAPEYVPLPQITYTYPVMDQKYFFPKQNSTQGVIKGRIKLKQTQNESFELLPNWKLKCYITDEADQTVETEFTYSGSVIYFDIPSTLENSKQYTLKLVKAPPANASIFAELTELYNAQTLSDISLDPSFTGTTSINASTVELRNRSLSRATIKAEPIEMLSYTFSTSAYNTFSEKMAAKKATGTLKEIVSSSVHKLKNMVDHTEPFDLTDVVGSRYSDHKPLITVKALLQDNYYKNEIYPIIYQGYPIGNVLTLDRVGIGLPISTSTFGTSSLISIPIGNLPTTYSPEPVAIGMELQTWYKTFLESDPNHAYLSERMPHAYNLPFHYHEDFKELRYKAANLYTENPALYGQYRTRIDNLMRAAFPYIKPGTYTTQYTFKAPGSTARSNVNYTYENPN